jgi:hypothetical protein
MIFPSLCSTKLPSSRFWKTFSQVVWRDWLTVDVCDGRIQVPLFP